MENGFLRMVASFLTSATLLVATAAVMNAQASAVSQAAPQSLVA